VRAGAGNHPNLSYCIGSQHKPLQAFTMPTKSLKTVQSLLNSGLEVSA
jgi:hypothetical protein